MAYPPYYGAAQAQPSHTETTSRPSAPIRSYPQQPERVALFGGLGRLQGVVPTAQQLAATAGSAAGGAGIGYVAAGKGMGKEGAFRGALVGVGLSSLGDTVAAARVRDWGKVGFSAVLTVVTAGYAVWRMRKNRRL